MRLFAYLVPVVLAVFCGPASADLGKVGHFLKSLSSQVEGSPAEGSLALPKAGSFDSCRQLFPARSPVDVSRVAAQWKSVPLCFNHFAVLHSGLSKTPLLVVERLDANQVLQAHEQKRTNEFYPDPRLKIGERAELSDYRENVLGFDRGHLANAADQPDQDAMVQSFALSNMVPQDPVNNRKGAWLKAEIDTRKYVKRATGTVYVFSGPLFQGDLRTIGRNRVWVPSHLFKLVFDESSGKSWAHIVANTPDAKLGAPLSYAEFVRQTGWAVL